jgi:FkbM family methyltransferase
MKATPDDLRHAYRLLLGREPDDAGFETLAKHIESSGASTSDVAAMFFASAEFKSLREDFAQLEEIAFEGLRLYPWRGDSLIGDLIRTTGQYEAYMLPLFVDSVPVGGTVLDVGANIGVYTLSAARKVGERGRVIAIEPVAKNVQSLCAGVVHNGFRNVSILPVAASADAGVIPMLRSESSSNGIVDTHAENPRSFVPSQRLDFLLTDLESLDVIKIDIEGHEPIAWPGIEPLVRKHRPLVFTEFNPVAIGIHSRVPPEQYLTALFEHARAVSALHLDGRRVACATPAEIMEQWRDANRRQNTVDRYHLDLLVDARA